MVWIAGAIFFLLVAVFALLSMRRSREDRPRAERRQPPLPAPEVGIWLGPGHDKPTPPPVDAAPPAVGDVELALDALTPEQERALLRGVYLSAFEAAGPVLPGTVTDPEVHAGIAASVAASLARIDADARHVPRRPHLLPQLTRAINDLKSSAQSIATILGQDPALAANLLRIVNSVAYRRRPEPVENLERAVALLGNDGLRQIVMAALLQPVIDDDGSPLGRCAVALWEHTLLAAKAAADHAAHDDPHAAQLLALLHGLGAVVVVQVLRDTYARRVAVVPQAATVVELLEAWAVPVAVRISSGWAISERTRQALADLQSGASTSADPLLAALRHGRLQAASDMRQGRG